MTDWLPIESAPRDGTRVLLWCPGIVIGRWSENAEFEQFKNGPGWQVFECEDSFYSWAEAAPISWQPLPKPPSPPSEQKGEK